MSTAARAESASAQDIAALIDAHGAHALVKVMMEVRHGEMSIERDGRIQQVWGRPSVDLVTPASLAYDARKAGLNIEALKKRLSRYVRLERKTVDQLTGRAEFAVIPLEQMDPDLRVWSPSRTWTVEALIEDAERYDKSRSEDANMYRKQEAFRRNKRLERILESWQARYGSAVMSDVERVLLKQARERRNACRGVHRRRQKAKWKELNCEEATRSSAMRPGRRLKDQIRKPFDDYKSAMNR